MIDYSHIKVNNLNARHEWTNVDQIILAFIQIFNDMNNYYNIVFKNKLPGIVSICLDKNRLKSAYLI